MAIRRRSEDNLSPEAVRKELQRAKQLGAGLVSARNAVLEAVTIIEPAVQSNEHPRTLYDIQAVARRMAGIAASVRGRRGLDNYGIRTGQTVVIPPPQTLKDAHAVVEGTARYLNSVAERDTLSRALIPPGGVDVMITCAQAVMAPFMPTPAMELPESPYRDPDVAYIAAPHPALP